ncbi:MAG: hypothetical protein O3A46_06350 [Candidatus Poribacteria bacterium]|nr:hypothetical protein [Candidatus Poribacteria bacterium]
MDTRSFSLALMLLLAVTLVADAQVAQRDPAKIAAEAIHRAQTDPDLAKYPTFREHIIRILERKATQTRPLALNPYASAILGGKGQPATETNGDDVADFYKSCAQDRLTIVRAMGFVARTVKETGVISYLNGRHARNALAEMQLDVGLAVPLRGLQFFAYVPPAKDDSAEVQCRFIAAYDAPYEHKFEKEVLDATLKIGTGRSVPYLDPWNSDATVTTVYLVEGKIVYGKAGVGYIDVKGIGGRKHGVLGVLQKAFFFIPDAIDGMVLRDGDLFVNAAVNQRVKDFEEISQYAVHRKDGTFANPPQK